MVTCDNSANDGSTTSNFVEGVKAKDELSDPTVCVSWIGHCRTAGLPLGKATPEIEDGIQQSAFPGPSHTSNCQKPLD